MSQTAASAMECVLQMVPAFGTRARVATGPGPGEAATAALRSTFPAERDPAA